MSIEREYKYFILECDYCNAKHDVEYDTFQDAVDGKKANGWKSKNEGGEWYDCCPECQSKK